jgi:hypothetical protein
MSMPLFGAIEEIKTFADGCYNSMNGSHLAMGQ